MTPTKTHSNQLAEEVLQVFDDLNGPQPGFRPGHAKGILIAGRFTPSPAAASLTRAPHIQRASTPVTVRFSDATGIPAIPDNAPEASPRGMAVRFHLAEHVHTDIISHSVDGFPVRTAEEFLEFLTAARDSGPSVVSPKPIEVFLGAHPAALAFVQAPKPAPASFTGETFYAVNAYRFTNQKGSAVTDATGSGPKARAGISIPKPPRARRRIFCSTKSNRLSTKARGRCASRFSSRRMATLPATPPLTGPPAVPKWTSVR
jgi:catalase